MKLKNNFSLALGTYLIGILFWVLATATTFFLFGSELHSSIVFIALIINSVTCFFLFQKNTKLILLISILSAIILFFSVVLNCNYFDWSWDGNDYHKSIIALLKNGWNPLLHTFYEYVSIAEFTFMEDIKSTWYDAYPKMSEIWAACMYCVTGNIEAGKNYNILSVIGCFFISYGLFAETKKLKNWQNIICSFFCAMNPVIFSQMFTYYNDGFLWTLILICIAALLYMTFYENGEFIPVCSYLIFISINVGFNIKFSAIIFYALICLSIFFYWTYNCAKSARSNIEKRHFILSRFAMFAVSVISGTVFTGATSYAINTFRYHNPVYTMIGEGSTEIISSMLPTVYKDLSNIQRFIASLFSRTSNNREITSIEWKLPFTFNRNEILEAQIVDVRTAGWGILFSGILLFSILVLIIIQIHYIKTNKNIKKANHLAILFLAILALSIVVVPGMSWARYNGAMFYFPIAALFYLMTFINTSPNKLIGKITITILSVLLLANMYPSVLSAKNMYLDSQQIKSDLQYLNVLSKHKDLTISYDNAEFYGRIFNLYDYGIKDFTIDYIEDDKVDGYIFNICRLRYAVEDRS